MGSGTQDIYLSRRLARRQLRPEAVPELTSGYDDVMPNVSTDERRSSLLPRALANVGHHPGELGAYRLH